MPWEDFPKIKERVSLTEEDQRQILGPLYKHSFDTTPGLEGKVCLDLCSIQDVKPGPGGMLKDQLLAKQKASAASATLLLGLSGSGKTRALIQAASSFWSLFLEAGEPGTRASMCSVAVLPRTMPVTPSLIFAYAGLFEWVFSIHFLSLEPA